MVSQTVLLRLLGTLFTTLCCHDACWPLRDCPSASSPAKPSMRPSTQGPSNLTWHGPICAVEHMPRHVSALYAAGQVQMLLLR